MDAIFNRTSIRKYKQLPVIYKQEDREVKK